MSDSLSLITAQIAFLDSQLALVHIPIEYYSFFIQPILRLLFGEDHDEDAAKIPWTNRHDFLNISITPIEVSIICSRELAERFIYPVDDALRELMAVRSSSGKGAALVREDYTVVQVDGQGMDAGQRVLELTGPLAMAGISIFFITTYFSDYILVPTRAKRIVTTALEQRGFIFSKAVDAFISQLSPSMQHHHSRYDSSSSTSSGWSPSHSRPTSASTPTTPPAKDIDELQLRTFRKLKSMDIRPQANKNLRVVSCAGSSEATAEADAELKDDLLQVLLATNPRPKSSATSLAGLHISNTTLTEDEQELDFSTSFLSITITSSEPISILLEERLLPRLGNSLLGAKEEDDVLVPIIFDLRNLGFETTGIVGGVAGRLSQGSTPRRLGYGMGKQEDDTSPKSTSGIHHDTIDGRENFSTGIEISFLSTAKSGMVIVKASQLKKALRELDRGYNELAEG